jgi:hypothetical protein
MIKKEDVKLSKKMKEGEGKWRLEILLRAEPLLCNDREMLQARDKVRDESVLYGSL